MKHRVASALADALLLSPAELTTARARCVEVLGKDYGWFLPLVQAVLRQFTGAWHSGSKDALVVAILKHPSFSQAWLGTDTPSVRKPVLTALAMAPRPARLAECEIPVLTTAGDVARWLEIEPEELDSFIDYGKWRTAIDVEPLRHYVYRWLPKRSGGFRLLEIPKSRLRACQRGILRDLLDRIPVHEAVHGFRPGRSALSNAAEHLGQRVVLRMDLKDFFLHVRGARVLALLRTLGYSYEVARLLAGICTNAVPKRFLDLQKTGDYESLVLDWLTRKRYHSAHLPQGAPTSPALANLCAFKLDCRLQGAATKLGARYTRYADDLSFSGGREFERSMRRFIPLAGAIALEEGFAINFRKTQVMQAAQRQQVTGVVVNTKPNLDRRDFDSLRAMLHNCVTHGPRSQNRREAPDFRSHLAGRIAHAASINPTRAARLQHLFARNPWDASSAGEPTKPV